MPVEIYRPFKSLVQLAAIWLTWHIHNAGADTTLLIILVGLIIAGPEGAEMLLTRNGDSD